MANRWYNNSTNILIEFTVARAGAVEAKLDDVAAAFDEIETEFDSLESRSLRHATASLAALTETAAARADKVVGFDALGAVSLKTPTEVATVLDSYTLVTTTATLESGKMYYFVSGGYTVTLPAAPVSGDFIVLKFDGGVRDDVITVDGNLKGISSYSQVVADVNYLELHLIYNGTEWKI